MSPGDAPSWFDQTLFEHLRQARGVTWGRPLRLLDSTASTNDLGLAAVATEAKTGIVWLAHEQTSGRGRRGNAWLASAGESLTVSILVRVPTPHTLGAGFSLLAGLGVRELVESRVAPAHQVAVKWPNDVLIDGQKCAGILVESRAARDGSSLGVVLGIGLNVRQLGFPAELGRATSLSLAGATDEGSRLEALLVDLLFALEQRTRQFLPRGLPPLLAELTRHDALLGQRVRVGELSGVAEGFDDEGRLLLRGAAGQTQAAQVGHVELLDAVHSGEKTSG